MIRKGILAICLLMLLCMAMHTLGETDYQMLGTVGSFSISRDMLRLLILQDETAKAISVQYGFVLPGQETQPIDQATAKAHLFTMAAAAQLAWGQGMNVKEIQVYQMVRQELVEYPIAPGQEYFETYATHIKKAYGGTVEGLLEVAVSLRTIEILADGYLQDFLEKLAADRNDEDAVSSLIKELQGVPVQMFGEELFRPSEVWLRERVFMLRSFWKQP